MKYETEIVKAYLKDDVDVPEEKRAYVKFKKPSQKALVLISEYRTSPEAILDILRHLENKVVSISGVEVDGEAPDVKEFLDWPSELVNLVLTAYFKALGGTSDPSDKDEAEKNEQRRLLVDLSGSPLLSRTWNVTLVVLDGQRKVVYLSARHPKGVLQKKKLPTPTSKDTSVVTYATSS